MLAEGARALEAVQGRDRAKLSATLNDALDAGSAIGEDALSAARASRAAMIAAATAWLGAFDALAVPSAPGPAPEGLHTTGDPSCCTLASLLGFPAITLPVGRAPNGLPISLQLVGLAGGDDELVATARWCETVLPRWRPPRP